MHHSKITTSRDIAVECVQLSLRSGGVFPQPVFDINAPIDYVRVVDMLSQLLAKTYSDGAEGWAEVFCCKG